MYLSSYPYIGVGRNFRKGPISPYLLVLSQQWNTKAMCEICSKLTIKPPEQRWRRFDLFNAAWKYY